MAKRRVPGKWIDGLSPALPVTEAAREVVGIRLEALELLLPLAAEHAYEDVEHVHRLRVATRRAEAALRTFGDCFKTKRVKKCRRRLQTIRRAAGEARECDVHGIALRDRRDSVTGVERAVLDDLLVWIGEMRDVAQTHVRDAADRYPRARLQRMRTRLLDTLRAPGRKKGSSAPPTSFHERAGAVVPELIAGVQKAAEADLTVLEKLHELRISCKRLRYAMEIFRTCFGSGFEEAYTLMKTLQDTLGVVNDDHEMAARILAFIADRGAGHDAAWGDAADALRMSYIARRDEDAAAFLSEWPSRFSPAISKLDELVVL